MHNLLATEFYRVLTLQMRYPLDFISGLLLLTLLFYGLLLGAQYVTGVENFGSNLDGMLVGYAAWMMVQSGLSQIPGDIQSDARRGTLENLFLSYCDVSVIFLMRALAGSIINLVLTVAVLVCLLWLTERHVAFPPALILPVVTTIAASIGLGFLAGGIALEAKQIGQMLLIAQYPLLFLMMTPFETFAPEVVTIALFLPVVPSAMTLRELMVSGSTISETHIVSAAMNATAYLVAGVAVFRLYVRKVKLKGALAGH